MSTVKMPRLSSFRIALLVTLVFLVLRGIRPDFMEMMELKAFDLQFLYRGAQRPGPEVVLVAVDEKSLDELGRWPWPRTRIAELLAVLDRSQARAVGFDLVFPEPDEHSQKRLVASLKERVFRQGREDPELSRL
ncbi:MAG: CHASE2 domain-containing protein, partial [Candidatus Tectomicrobia bacterium]|nr:CHASE2 domain-containing protein [Candidatus Tectomicrobia bacterium]